MNNTKKYKIAYRLLAFLSFLLLITPLAAYTIIGLSSAAVTSKLTLSCAVIAAAILTVLSLITKHAIRSGIFIILLGLATALTSITECLILICIANILDELIITPLKKHYKSKYVINKEIDKRFN